MTESKLTTDCRGYIDSLHTQSPIVSTSHYRLHQLYMTYGNKSVDAEIERLFRDEPHLNHYPSTRRNDNV